MPKAVRFDEYGGVDVLHVVEVERPSPAAGEVLVRVETAGINFGEVKIRDGRMQQWWPATFPSGQGSDLAGVVEEIGAGVSAWQPGDEVIGFTDNRASHAELVVAQVGNLTRRPPGVPWEVAGALFVAGAAAWASVRAMGAGPQDTVVVSGGAGGVGSLAVQLAKLKGATVIGLAGDHNHAWLRDRLSRLPFATARRLRPHQRLLPGDAPVIGSGELRNRSIGGKLPDEGSDSVCMVRQALHLEPSLSQQDPQVCMVRRAQTTMQLLSHHAHEFGRR